jgi:uncharacterized membrane protein YphA (DoxX/SURF4 family)
MLEKIFAPYSDLGLLILRSGLAIVLLVHGWLKVNPDGPVKGPARFAAGLKKMGFPFARQLAWIVVLLETLGAGLLVLGLGTRVVAALVVIMFLVIILYVKRRVMKTSFLGTQTTAGWELDFTILVGAIALLFTGAGAIALDPVVGL